MAGAAALLVQGILGYALVVGLGVKVPIVMQEALTLVALPPDRPAPPVKKPVAPSMHGKRHEGKAAPPDIRSQATQVVAPPPVVLPLTLPPMIAAKVAGPGRQATQGAAPVTGPGTGAGGTGNGTGGGGQGFGEDEGGRAETPPRWIRGRLKDSDYPRGAGDAGAQGSVGVRFTVEPDGRVDQCVIRASSGSAELDGTTCRLIERRYRYRPARDADGRPVRSRVVEDHDWAIAPEAAGDR